MGQCGFLKLRRLCFNITLASINTEIPVLVARINGLPNSSARILAICKCCQGPILSPNQASLEIVSKLIRFFFQIFTKLLTKNNFITNSWRKSMLFCHKRWLYRIATLERRHWQIKDRIKWTQQTF